MIKSLLRKSFVAASVMLSLAMAAFKTVPDAAQMVAWGNHCLLQAYDPNAEEKIKKWEINITPEYFLRMRKTYQTGKQEYFSFHLRNFEDLDYLGTTSAGLMRIRTKSDNIIVQTHGDRKGNIDTMATSLTIPVRNMEPDQVDSLRKAMFAIRDSQVGEGN